MDQLCIVTTGGTIDKIYFDDKSDYQIGAPQIGEILTQLGVGFRFDVIPILRKDSLHVTDEDRALMRSTIEAQPHRHVLVTHGTDTMVETGKFLDRELAKPLQVPVILTGAMVPLGFEGTDGIQNLTESLLAAKLLPPGVYVVMHNQTFPVNRVRKDRDLGTFVRTE